ncbi:MFS transporter [Rhodococcus sp. WWJCD1]|uniref:MFS transporter n=1 Tax=unclassified Rhodococcus (in: high G+C Gram-positive bacteria) TaxID=192944 RepID=UPI000B9BB265|nr:MULTISPECIES: MFS transporter [unclassified Rhodococcus (in: high G+C Gram-positive bacteria)]OZC42563.1 MFS transporter [Rhodococcus sp. WWJCD1]OZE89360.1 MFS transporter [Rhodococcus sp. 15-2388-1-1a]
MKTLLTQFRSFDRPSQVLMVNQFSINVGFYMLMPYLAGYLAGPLGLAAWAVGLVLGMRNFSQQGMFLLGGTLADRLGYKPLIIAGCLLRVAGFVLLAAAESLPAILLASAATGFAGALFNPAVRAYLAADAGPRRVEAFAVFNVFYQAGILLGPLIGLALTTLDFRVTSLAAAAIFAVLTIVQIWTLPAHRAETAVAKTSVLEDWRVVMANRPFVLFALAMIGSYVLSFQIYLALPLQAAVVVGDGRSDTALVTSLFVVSGVVAIAGQFRITSWLSRRWGSGRSVVVGMAIMALAFLPLIVLPSPAALGGWAAAGALVLTAALLAVGTAAVFPFEMDTVVTLSGGKLVATHYGFYNTIVGVGILLGNLGTGAVFGLLSDAHLGALIWAILTLVGAASVAALYALDRSDRLTPPPTETTVTESGEVPATS